MKTPNFTSIYIIGLIILSNVSILQSYAWLWILRFPITLYIASVALSNNSLTLRLKALLLQIVAPRYLKLLTISNWEPSKVK